MDALTRQVDDGTLGQAARPNEEMRENCQFGQGRTGVR